MKLSDCPECPFDLLIKLSESALSFHGNSSCSYFGLLATVSSEADASPGQRWMHIIEHTTDDKVLFLTRKGSQKVKDVANNPKATLTLSVGGNKSVIAMKGQISVIEGLKFCV